MFDANGTVSAEASGVKPATGQAWYSTDVVLWFRASSTFSSVVSQLFQPVIANESVLPRSIFRQNRVMLQAIGDNEIIEFILTSTGIANGDMD